MKNRFTTWLINSITRKINPALLEHYEKTKEDLEDICFLLLLFVVCLLIPSYLSSNFWGPFVFYSLAVVMWIVSKYYGVLIELTTQAKSLQDAMGGLSELLKNGGGSIDYNAASSQEALQKILANPEALMASMQEMSKEIQEMKQRVSTNNAENADFLKEIEKNIGKF